MTDGTFPVSSSPLFIDANRTLIFTRGIDFLRFYSELQEP